MKTNKVKWHGIPYGSLQNIASYFGVDVSTLNDEPKDSLNDDKSTKPQANTNNVDILEVTNNKSKATRLNTCDDGFDENEIESLIEHLKCIEKEEVEDNSDNIKISSNQNGGVSAQKEGQTKKRSQKTVDETVKIHKPKRKAKK